MEMDSLTPREVEVLALLAEGLSNKGIAKTLNLSISTISTHLYQVYLKIRLMKSDGDIRVKATLFYLKNKEEIIRKSKEKQKRISKKPPILIIRGKKEKIEIKEKFRR